MHFATKHGGAQIYPSCIQVNVTGSQAKSLPSDAALVSFPGAYKATDPGIFTPKIFTQRDYVFPGPPVVDFGGSKEQALTDGAGLDDAEDDCQEPLIAEAPGHAKRSRIMRDVHR